MRGRVLVIVALAVVLAGADRADACVCAFGLTPKRVLAGGDGAFTGRLLSVRRTQGASEASPPGSVWWRAVNERLLRDGCETVALLGGLPGQPSSRAVRLWLEFAAIPTGRNWYRAHNASIVAAYLEHRDLAEAEGAPKRF